MDILSFPVGLLAGVIPVVVSLTPSESPATLYLDGRAVCTLSWQSNSCQVDLGSRPAVHRLELVGPPREGGVSKAQRWINRPGQEAEVYLRVNRREDTIHVNVSWAHPDKRVPREIRLRVGSVEYVLKPGEPFVWHQTLAEPAILVAEAVFPDGQTAERALLLQDAFQEKAESFLSPILVDVGQGADMPQQVLGYAVQAVEEGDAVIGVVAHPAAVRPLADEVLAASFAGSRRSQHLDSRIPFLRQIVAIAATPELPERKSLGKPSKGKGKRAGGLATLPAMLPFGSRNEPRRFADAVALAGFRVGSWAGRRAVVLFLDRECTNDQSVFDAMGVARYLEQLRVPLVVWSIGSVHCPQWPAARPVASLSRFDEALGELEDLLRRQRVLWLRGELPFPVSLPMSLLEWPVDICPRQRGGDRVPKDK